METRLKFNVATTTSSLILHSLVRIHVDRFSVLALSNSAAKNGTVGRRYELPAVRRFPLCSLRWESSRRRSSGRDRYAIHDPRVNGDIRRQQIFTRDVYRRPGSRCIYSDVSATVVSPERDDSEYTFACWNKCFAKKSLDLITRSCANINCYSTLIRDFIY